MPGQAPQFSPAALVSVRPAALLADLAHTYKKIRFNIDPDNDHSGLRQWESANSVQFTELRLYGGLGLLRGTVTNSGGRNPVKEGPSKLMDMDIATKWCVRLALAGRHWLVGRRLGYPRHVRMKLQPLFALLLAR